MPMDILAQSDAIVNQRQCVILLHGLSRSTASMMSVEARLHQAGYHVINQGYASHSATIPVLAENAIPAAIKACPEGTAINFVTHSMGGILVRAYYAEHPNAHRPRAVVMMGPPNHGSEIIDEQAYAIIGGAVGGSAGAQLSAKPDSFVNSLPPVDYPTGIIAGDLSLNPIYSEMIPGADDGKVSVASTAVAGMRDHVTLATTHTFMMFNNAVIEQILAFLRAQIFTHD